MFPSISVPVAKKLTSVAVPTPGIVKRLMGTFCWAANIWLPKLSPPLRIDDIVLIEKLMEPCKKLRIQYAIIPHVL